MDCSKPSEALLESVGYFASVLVRLAGNIPDDGDMGRKD